MNPGRIDVDVVVIGGGPAGAATARLLALWDHSVLLLTKTADPSRGAAESLPPSTRKLLAEIGALEAVDRAGFYRTTGNTVWWGLREGRVEKFDVFGEASGYQVFRPDLDRLLQANAAAAGAKVVCDAHVRRVSLDERTLAHVEYQRDGRAPTTVACRFAVDCSGRAGVIARQGFRRHQAGYRMQAFIGVWRSAAGWKLADQTHTLVETYEDGWAWSVPLSALSRQVGLAVDGATTRIRRGPTLHGTYRAEIAKTHELGRLMSAATLERVWACDASLYWSHCYGGPQFLLVGDAGSCIDPLSSFGVKKAFASAWVGAIVVNTCLVHPDSRDVALEFFSSWERKIYASNLHRSRAFSREAYSRHPHPFWAARADTEVETISGDIDEESLFKAPDVQAAFQSLKASRAIDLVLASGIRLEKRAVIRDREIVLDEAIALPGFPDGLRFLAGVDLLKLGAMACRYHQVPDLFDAYCRTHGAVALPSLLGALSVLVAKRVLTARA
jgi:2-polyprenyl-6-methoxyphenol hydroxylase-like FAD-dependent oxidoreductase